MGAYARVEYKSPYLNYVVSYPPPLQREEGWILVGHICICLLISKTGFLCKHKYREGEGRGVRADLISLKRHFMEDGQPHAVAGFNSLITTMNLGSAFHFRLLLYVTYKKRMID